MGVKYLLDSNTCIQLLTGRNPQVAEKLHTHHPKDIYLCSIVVSELAYGAFKSVKITENLTTLEIFRAQFDSLPFDDAAALVSGEIRAELARKGTPIGPFDLQIAAIALVQNAILVTNNLREFTRVSGLLLEDWQS